MEASFLLSFHVPTSDLFNTEEAADTKGQIFL